MRRAGKLFDCPHVPKNGCNAYVLSCLGYWGPECMLSAESHLGLQDRIVRSAERLIV